MCVLREPAGNACRDLDITIQKFDPAIVDSTIQSFEVVQIQRREGPIRFCHFGSVGLVNYLLPRFILITLEVNLCTREVIKVACVIEMHMRQHDFVDAIGGVTETLQK
jgi:hypothetical protein